MSDANRNRTIRPSQYTGIETKNSAVPIALRSSHVRRLIAEMIPTGIPISNHRITAPTVSESVAGNRSFIRLITDWPL